MGGLLSELNGKVLGFYIVWVIKLGITHNYLLFDKQWSAF